MYTPWGYDEPEILRYSNRQFGPIGADAGHYDILDFIVNLSPDPTVHSLHSDGYTSVTDRINTQGN